MKDAGLSKDEIDEVIAYGYSPKMGVGLARILGDNMNPSDIMKMMNEVKRRSIFTVYLRIG